MNRSIRGCLETLWRIQEVLWPGGNREHDWSPDTLNQIAEIASADIGTQELYLLYTDGNGKISLQGPFDTLFEREAFKEGVEWVNDSMISLEDEPNSRAEAARAIRKIRADKLEDAPSDTPMYCRSCGYDGFIDDFTPTDGNPAPFICPTCGGTECFIKGEGEEVSRA